MPIGFEYRQSQSSAACSFSFTPQVFSSALSVRYYWDATGNHGWLVSKAQDANDKSSYVAKIQRMDS